MSVEERVIGTARRRGTFARLTVAAVAAACAAAMTLAAVPAAAQDAEAEPASTDSDPLGYQTLFDGTEETFDLWEYAGDGGFDLVDDGTMVSRVGDDGGFGTLWYAAEEFADFSLKLEFRDDAPEGQRANSGVQVRFPEMYGPVEGCPTTFDGNETNNLSWIAVNCGHEIQINDAEEGDDRKTGSIYGFQDLNLEEARPVEKGEWSTLEVRVVGEFYTVIRDGVIINEYENVHGVYMEGRPNDPPAEARGLVGHVGLQAHGADQDIVSFRNVRIRELSENTTVCDRNQGGATFPDVQGLGLRSFIDCLAEIGVVEGKQDGNYDPRGDVTRGQLASFVVRAMETANGTTLPTGETSFPDVNPGSTHGQAILKLAEAGIIQGYTDGTFGPADAVSREQTSRFVFGAIETLMGDALVVDDVLHEFDDVQPGSRFAQDISRLVSLGVVEGYGDGNFGPRDSVTRAQMAKFVANSLEVVAGGQLYLGP